MAPERITLQQAADSLGVHYMTAYRYVRTGRLDAVKVGAEWRVDPADLVGLAVGRRAAGPVDRDRQAPVAAGPDDERWHPEPSRLAGRLIDGDDAGAWHLIQDALTAGATNETVYTRLIVPAMAEVGERWRAGHATIADEHAATVTVQRLAGRLAPSFNRPGRKRGTVVLGAAPGDQHGLSVGLLADPLRGRGFKVIDLGANVPVDAWVDATRGAERLRVVGVSSITPGLDTEVAATIAAVHDATDAPVILGGDGVADEAHALALGADGWAGTQQGALDLIERLTAS